MNRWETLKKILILLLPSLLIGAIVGAYPGYQLYRYTWYDARFCTTCHVHDYASVGWSKSIHGSTTTCHDCHHQRLRDYIKEAIVMLKDHPHFPKDLHHTPYVQKEICAACHVSNASDRSTITGPFTFEDVEKIPKVDKSYLHSIHLKKKTDLVLLNHENLSEQERNLEKLAPVLDHNREKLSEERSITCADCHGGPQNRGHNFSSVDNTCVRCHEKSHESNVTKQFGCRNCHYQDFMIPTQNKIDKIEMLKKNGK